MDYVREKLLLKKLRIKIKEQIEDNKKYNWLDCARPNQIPPSGNWKIWLLMAGRGFGKTRTRAETLRTWIKAGICKRIALISNTDIECRQVMVEGESGLLSIHPPWERPSYEPSNKQIIWPNGATANCFSAEAYEHLRGPQFDGAWIDELAKFQQGEKVMDQLMFALRLGKNPRAIITTTPRPTSLIKRLLKNPFVHLTKGSTFENAQNLALSFLDYIKNHYESKPLGRQELYADIIEDQPHALWKYASIEHAKSSYRSCDLKRIVVAIDPAVSHGANSDETGIIVAGITSDDIGVVVADLSMKGPAHTWAQKAIQAYHHYKADRIIAEVNMGGELIEQLLREYDPTVSYKPVRAMRGKMLRAEPIATLYERGKIWHAPHLSQLEEQLLSYIPGETSKSPDRLDALVWAFTDLMLLKPPSPKIW